MSIFLNLEQQNRTTEVFGEISSEVEIDGRASYDISRSMPFVVKEMRY
jgi:hypothetical protein